MPLSCENYQCPVIKIKEELSVSTHNIYIYIYIYIYTHTKPINGREKKSVLDPSVPKQKDASSNHVVDRCPQCCHQSLQYRPLIRLDKVGTSVYDSCAQER